MKKVRYSLLLFLLASLVVGCKENMLQLDKEQICVTYEGAQQCQKAAGGPMLLKLVDGKPALSPVAGGRLDKDVDFVQYLKPVPVTAASVGIAVEAGKLVVLNGAERIVDESGSGLLIRHTDGGYAITAAAADGLKEFENPKLIDMTKIRGRISLIAEDLGNQVAMMNYINLEINNDGTQFVPNDTGTAVIITDNFRLLGSCSAPMPAECCANSDPEATPADWSGLVEGYAAGGQRLLACFPVGYVCTYVSGLKVIVKECNSDRKYCINLLECDLTIETSDENGVCFLVNTECTMDNPFD